MVTLAGPYFTADDPLTVLPGATQFILEGGNLCRDCKVELLVAGKALPMSKVLVETSWKCFGSTIQRQRERYA